MDVRRSRNDRRIVQPVVRTHRTQPVAGRRIRVSPTSRSEDSAALGIDTGAPTEALGLRRLFLATATIGSCERQASRAEQREFACTPFFDARRVAGSIDGPEARRPAPLARRVRSALSLDNRASSNGGSCSVAWVNRPVQCRLLLLGRLGIRSVRCPLVGRVGRTGAPVDFLQRDCHSSQVGPQAVDSS